MNEEITVLYLIPKIVSGYFIFFVINGRPNIG